MYNPEEVGDLLEKLEDLERAVALLDAAKDRERAKREAVEKRIAKDRKYHDFLEGAYSGISHLSVTSDEWHKANDTMSKKMFGMEWEEVKAFVVAMFDLEQKDLTPADLKKQVRDWNERHQWHDQV